MQSNSVRNKKQKGFITVDNILGMVIWVVGLIAMFALAKLGQNLYDKYALMRDVNGVKVAVKSLVGGSDYGVAVLNADLIQSDDVPTSLTNDGVNVITNKWGGAVVITGNTQTFTISMAAVPRSLCTKAVAPATDYVSVAVNGAAALPAPITQAQATAACNAAANTIVWTAS